MSDTEHPDFPERPQPPPRPNRGARTVRTRRSPLVTTIMVLAGLGVLFTLIAEFWTELLWYRQTGFSQVFTTRLITQGILFVVAAALMAGSVYGAMMLAYRRRPVYAPVTFEPAGMERYREGIEPLRRTLSFVIPGALGLFAGSTAMQQWRNALLFFNAKSFGVNDPQFNQDVGFYVFRLPFLQFVAGLLTTVLVMCLIAALVTHYVYGGIRMSPQGVKFTKVARAQVGLTLAGLLVAQAVSYWFLRYALLTQSGDRITGATYTGINAVLPTRTALAIIALLIAALFCYAAFRGAWRLPALGVVLMLLAGIVLGQAYPAAVQQFKVRPSAATIEPEYLQRGITATRDAYGMTDLQPTEYSPKVVAQQGALSREVQTAASIRIMDPLLVSPAFRQLQRQRDYYTFADALDVSRYTIDGTSRDTVLAVRELDMNQQRDWANAHTVYTHGFGLVAAYGNQRLNNGQPLFFERDLPSGGQRPMGPLGEYEPRIYFGEKSTLYSIVGGSGPDRELDYQPAGGDTDQVKYTFTGDGGPKIGNPLVRLMYALKYRDQNILFTNTIQSDSQILYDRTPRERVQKVAPFLTLDGDVYPAVVNKRIVWIVDAYTTSNSYPYSQRMPLGDATADAVTQRVSSVQSATGDVNYLRNSVKATVDAYSGEVKLYSWDEDPIIEAWKSAMPGTVRPMSEISGSLMSQLRYPEDLFKVQREVLAKYHVQDGRTFFNGSDFWKTPENPQRESAQAQTQPGPGQQQQQPQQPAAPSGRGKQPPYYMTLRMPGTDEATFSLTTSFIPEGNNASTADVLRGFMAVDANAGSKDGERAPGYGKLRLITPTTQVAGPGQAQNDFNTDPTARDSLALLERGNSEVDLGNLLTLPIAEGFLYVQPVYVKSASGTSFPLLQKVLAMYGDRVGFANTLDQALDQVFQGNSGARAGDAAASGGQQTPSAPSTQTPAQQLAQALQQARNAINEGQEALTKNDFEAYGKAQAKLKAAVEAATRAQQSMDASASSTPSPGASPTP